MACGSLSFCYSQPDLEASCIEFMHCKPVASEVGLMTHMVPFFVCGNEVGLITHMVDLLCRSHW